jgi:hypothetical protein
MISWLLPGLWQHERCDKNNKLAATADDLTAASHVDRTSITNTTGTVAEQRAVKSDKTTKYLKTMHTHEFLPVAIYRNAEHLRQQCTQLCQASCWLSKDSGEQLETTYLLQRLLTTVQMCSGSTANKFDFLAVSNCRTNWDADQAVIYLLLLNVSFPLQQLIGELHWLKVHSLLFRRNLAQPNKKSRFCSQDFLLAKAHSCFHLQVYSCCHMKVM